MNTAALPQIIVIGHTFGSSEGTMTPIMIVLLALVVVVMIAGLWFALTDAGNRAWGRVSRIWKSRR